MYKDKKRINKNGYVVIEDNTHHKSFDTGTGINGVYEHQLIAEDLIGRNLKENEVVHHLDNNRSNNSPDNILVLDNSQHSKLHRWLDKNLIIPKPTQLIRNLKGCVRCSVCEKPIEPSMKTCSVECYKISIKCPDDIDYLEEAIKVKPLTTIAKELGISDNGVKSRCKSLGIDIPKREPGFWTKKRFGLV